MIITNLKIVENKLKKRHDEGITTICPLCNKPVAVYDNVVYVKNKLHEVYAHKKCYDKLF